MRTAERLKKITATLKVPLIFKSSFSKDNRSSLDYYQGPGLDEGLRVLEKMKREFELPMLTDIHYPYQAAPAAEVVRRAADSRLPVHAVGARSGRRQNRCRREHQARPVHRAREHGEARQEDRGRRETTSIIVTERGYTFGYNDLDRRSAQLSIARRRSAIRSSSTSAHSIRKYGIPSKDPRGSARQFLTTLARSGVAAGVDGFFIEAHPNPPDALCDAASQYYSRRSREFMRAADRHSQPRSLAVGALEDAHGTLSRLGRLQRDRSRARLRFHQGTDDDADVHAPARHHRHRRRDRQAVEAWCPELQVEALGDTPDDIRRRGRPDHSGSGSSGRPSSRCRSRTKA